MNTLTVEKNEKLEKIGTEKRIELLTTKLEEIEEAMQFAKDMDLEDYLDVEILELANENNRKEVDEMKKEKTANILTKLEFSENGQTVDEKVKRLEQRLEELCLYFFNTEPEYPEYLEIGGEYNAVS